MSKNGVAKTLSRIGILIIIIGAFFSAVLGFMTQNLIIIIGGAIGSGIAGVVFIGFAEAIDLLQESLKEQIEINKALVTQTEVLLTLNESLEALNENLNRQNTK